MIWSLKTRSKDRSLRQLLQELRCFQDGLVSAFVIARFATDMHAAIVTDLTGTVYTMIVAWL